MADLQRVSLDEIVVHFQDLEDPRSAINQRHPLASVVVIALLAVVACAEKSNEITAIPELLRLVDIKGAIITIDAMGAQKAIAAQIVEEKADYVLALKGNQETLHQAVIDHINDQLEGDLGDAQEQT